MQREKTNHRIYHHHPVLLHLTDSMGITYGVVCLLRLEMGKNGKGKGKEGLNIYEQKYVNNRNETTQTPSR